MTQGGFVYILTNKPHGVLYTGVTANIDERIWQHRNDHGSKFCRKYGVNRLVHVEEYPTIIEAIVREKRIKKWRRAWKIELIEAGNPTWAELGPRFV